MGQYRLMQEGLELVIPHMDDRRIVQVEPDFFRKLTQEPDKSFTFDQIKEKFNENLQL